ncbi:MAG TPA: ATP synthase F1 subunit delta [Candidatus Limnocylindria bacterium]|nr:ATP synthase F1 subunit delta [Candidatus Limnocylindria bacterium]
MARRDTAARRYAEAAFQIGRQDRNLDAWERDLARIGELMQNDELRRIVEHPVVPFADKERLLVRVAGPDTIREAVELVLLMVRRGRPRAILPMIRHFGELLRRERGIVLAEVRTALPLDDAQRGSVEDRLAELTGEKVEMNEVVDEALIGGIAVRIGDRLYDASVRNRLERLRARLTTV